MVPVLVFRQQWRSAKLEDDASPAKISRGRARFYGFLYSLLVLGPVFAGAFAKGLVKGMPAKDALLISLAGIGMMMAIVGVIWLLQRYIERE